MVFSSALRQRNVPVLSVPLLWWGVAGVAQLTERERVIIALVATGFSNKQIADKEGVEPTTVRGHIYNIMRKMGVRNRTQLAMAGLLAGLVDVEAVVAAWEVELLAQSEEGCCRFDSE